MEYYFAYGSNMSVKRLAARCKSCQLVGRATLPKHKLMFHKPGNDDGSGKCNAFYTGRDEDSVLGVIFSMSQPDIFMLDSIEGQGYQRESFSVFSESHSQDLKVYGYIATKIEEDIKPKHWYIEHVLRGAREHQFPEEYIEKIKQTEYVIDEDLHTTMRELSIYQL